MTLNELLHPVTLADFRTDYFNIRPLHVPGPAARFAAFHAMDERDSSPAITALAHALELDLEAPIRVMPRSDWQGLPLHRGERDSMVLQTAGADLWRVHGREAQPSPESTWEAELSEGGALYIPRGWWYSAEPQGTHTLNLTFRIENPTGADLLFWLAEKLKQHAAFDADIPRFAGPAAKSQYLADMRHAVMQAFRNPDLLERFTQRLNARASLPAAPAPGMQQTEADSRACRIALAAPRRPTVRRTDKETIHFRVGGVKYPFPVDAAPLLIFLFEQAPLPAADFYSQFEGEFDSDEISEFLAVLQQAGIITLAAAASAP